MGIPSVLCDFSPVVAVDDGSRITTSCTVPWLPLPLCPMVTFTPGAFSKRMLRTRKRLPLEKRTRAGRSNFFCSTAFHHAAPCPSIMLVVVLSPSMMMSEAFLRLAKNVFVL